MQASWLCGSGGGICLGWLGGGGGWVTGGADDSWSKPSSDKYDPSAKASRYSSDGASSRGDSYGSAGGDRYGSRGGGDGGGDWDCSDCGFSNFASRSECYRCHAPKGA